jgi:hypothetical protein
MCAAAIFVHACPIIQLFGYFDFPSIDLGGRLKQFCILTFLNFKMVFEDIYIVVYRHEARNEAFFKSLKHLPGSDSGSIFGATPRGSSSPRLKM